MNISVVIPVYNKEQFVVDCIRSVLLQKKAPRELIIVNDGSTDNSFNVIDEFIKNNESEIEIKVINIENSGVSIARNTGVEHAISEYVAFLDSDDTWDEGFLLEMSALVEKYPNSGIFSCNHKINRENYGISVAICPLHENYFGLIDYFKLSQKYSVVNSSKVIVKKSVFSGIGGFPPNVRNGEDLYVWIKMALVSDVVFINKSMVTINQFSDDSRVSRVNDVLYPLMKIKKIEYKHNLELKKYLLILYRNSFLFRLKEGNKKGALNIFFSSYKISPIYTSLFLPFILFPVTIMNSAYERYKQGK
ncbi:TPA: glycosyltransferase family 2 protein [Vibrio parahaemolyticus]|nr:glycosyltransferase family 2 protein [Vibrio parahaemolyticus]HBC3977288.1 glycosyltransferase family 2 protein [Vibrio parahaemolyticus]